MQVTRALALHFWIEELTKNCKFCFDTFLVGFHCKNLLIFWNFSKGASNCVQRERLRICENFISLGTLFQVSTWGQIFSVSIISAHLYPCLKYASLSIIWLNEICWSQNFLQKSSIHFTYETNGGKWRKWFISLIASWRNLRVI